MPLLHWLRTFRRGTRVRPAQGYAYANLAAAGFGIGKVMLQINIRTDVGILKVVSH
jgi:hypothetical protein